MSGSESMQGGPAAAHARRRLVRTWMAAAAAAAAVAAAAAAALSRSEAQNHPHRSRERAAAAPHLLEDRLRVARVEAGAAKPAGAAAHAALEPLLAKLVVHLALLRV